MHYVKLVDTCSHLQFKSSRLTVDAGGIQLGRAAVLIMLTRTGSCCDEFKTDLLCQRGAK